MNMLHFGDVPLIPCMASPDDLILLFRVPIQPGSMCSARRTSSLAFYVLWSVCEATVSEAGGWSAHWERGHAPL